MKEFNIKNLDKENLQQDPKSQTPSSQNSINISFDATGDGTQQPDGAPVSAVDEIEIAVSFEETNDKTIGGDQPQDAPKSPRQDSFIDEQESINISFDATGDGTQQPDGAPVSAVDEIEIAVSFEETNDKTIGGDQPQDAPKSPRQGSFIDEQESINISFDATGDGAKQPDGAPVSAVDEIEIAVSFEETNDKTIGGDQPQDAPKSPRQDSFIDEQESINISFDATGDGAKQPDRVPVSVPDEEENSSLQTLSIDLTNASTPIGKKFTHMLDGQTPASPGLSPIPQKFTRKKLLSKYSNPPMSEKEREREDREVEEVLQKLDGIIKRPPVYDFSLSAAVMSYERTRIEDVDQVTAFETTASPRKWGAQFSLTALPDNLPANLFEITRDDPSGTEEATRNVPPGVLDLSVTSPGALKEEACTFPKGVFNLSEFNTTSLEQQPGKVDDNEEQSTLEDFLLNSDSAPEKLEQYLASLGIVNRIPADGIELILDTATEELQATTAALVESAVEEAPNSAAEYATDSILDDLVRNADEPIEFSQPQPVNPPQAPVNENLARIQTNLRELLWKKIKEDQQLKRLAEESSEPLFLHLRRFIDNTNEYLNKKIGDAFEQLTDDLLSESTEKIELQVTQFIEQLNFFIKNYDNVSTLLELSTFEEKLKQKFPQLDREKISQLVSKQTDDIDSFKKKLNSFYKLVNKNNLTLEKSKDQLTQFWQILEEKVVPKILNDVMQPASEELLKTFRNNLTQQFTVLPQECESFLNFSENSFRLPLYSVLLFKLENLYVSGEIKQLRDAIPEIFHAPLAKNYFMFCLNLAQAFTKLKTLTDKETFISELDDKFKSYLYFMSEVNKRYLETLTFLSVQLKQAKHYAVISESTSSNAIEVKSKSEIIKNYFKTEMNILTQYSADYIKFIFISVYERADQNLETLRNFTRNAQQFIKTHIDTQLGYLKQLKELSENKSKAFDEEIFKIKQGFTENEQNVIDENIIKLKTKINTDIVNAFARYNEALKKDLYSLDIESIKKHFIEKQFANYLQLLKTIKENSKAKILVELDNVENDHSEIRAKIEEFYQKCFAIEKTAEEIVAFNSGINQYLQKVSGLRTSVEESLANVDVNSQAFREVIESVSSATLEVIQTNLLALKETLDAEAKEVLNGDISKKEEEISQFTARADAIDKAYIDFLNFIKEEKAKALELLGNNVAVEEIYNELLKYAPDISNKNAEYKLDTFISANEQQLQTARKAVLEQLFMKHLKEEKDEAVAKLKKFKYSKLFVSSKTTDFYDNICVDIPEPENGNFDEALEAFKNAHKNQIEQFNKKIELTLTLTQCYEKLCDNFDKAFDSVSATKLIFDEHSEKQVYANSAVKAVSESLSVCLTYIEKFVDGGIDFSNANNNEEDSLVVTYLNKLFAAVDELKASIAKEPNETKQTQQKEWLINFWQMMHFLADNRLTNNKYHIIHQALLQSEDQREGLGLGKWPADEETELDDKITKAALLKTDLERAVPEENLENAVPEGNLENPELDAKITTLDNIIKIQQQQKITNHNIACVEKLAQHYDPAANEKRGDAKKKKSIDELKTGFQKASDEYYADRYKNPNQSENRELFKQKVSGQVGNYLSRIKSKKVDQPENNAGDQDQGQECLPLDKHTGSRRVWFGVASVAMVLSTIAVLPAIIYGLVRGLYIHQYNQKVQSANNKIDQWKGLLPSFFDAAKTDRERAVARIEEGILKEEEVDTNNIVPPVA